MTDDAERDSYIIDVAGLPANYPTHRHDSSFWEELGRTVATFGFLEATLGNAIFAVTATTEYSGDAVEEAVEKWTSGLEKALTDTLGAKISGYESALRANSRVTIGDLDLLIEDLRTASRFRNALCHGSWGLPDASGASVPHFVDRKFKTFKDPVDIAYLRQKRRETMMLVISVINSVTTMGYQFPGSSGPGERIWTKS